MSVYFKVDIKYHSHYYSLHNMISPTQRLMMEEPRPRVIKRYKKRNGREPFAEWLKDIQDKTTVKNVLDRLERVKLGDLGFHRQLGETLLELKFKSGIRIYCADIDNLIIVLLCAGDKNTRGGQRRDIARAEEYWADFIEQEQEN